MTVQTVRETPITRPATTLFKSSVLDHATIKDVGERESFGLRNEAGMWPSYNCSGPAIPVPFHCEPSEDPRKYGDMTWVPGFGFRLERGIACGLVGLNRTDMVSEYKRVFAAYEGRSVEKALRLYRFVEQTPGSEEDPNGAQWTAPVDLTAPLPDVPLTVALALLEGYAAENYAGVPTIHMSRAAASFLDDRIKWEGDLAYTRLGSKVAMGGGYDDDLETGEWTMYATGEVFIERKPVTVHDLVVVPGDGSQATPSAGLEDNMALVTGDRLYRAAVDCFVASATGKVW